MKITSKISNGFDLDNLSRSSIQIFNFEQHLKNFSRRSNKLSNTNADFQARKV